MLPCRYAGTFDWEVYTSEQVGGWLCVCQAGGHGSESIHTTWVPLWCLALPAGLPCNRPSARPVVAGAQVTTQGGSAVITMAETGPANKTAFSQQPDGRVWNVSKGYKSGFVDSWNKFW